MSNNPSLHPPTLDPLLVPLQSLDRMERAPGLERANSLQILALEPQPDDGLRGGGACALLRRGGERAERGVGEHGRLVDVRLDELVGGEHAGA